MRNTEQREMRKVGQDGREYSVKIVPLATDLERKHKRLCKHRNPCPSPYNHGGPKTMGCKVTIGPEDRYERREEEGNYDA